MSEFIHMNYPQKFYVNLEDQA